LHPKTTKKSLNEIHRPPLKKFSLILLVVLLLVGVAWLWRYQSNTSTVKSVGIQPFGSFPQQHIDSVRSAIQKQYGFNVYVLPQKPLPQHCFVQLKSPRYRADKLLKYLKNIRPDTIHYMLGLTKKDISTTKRDKNGRVKKPKSKYEDWGIFGLGYRPGQASIVSSFRLNKPGKTIERLQKVCVHELGHNLGLEHCTSKLNCVMDDAAETIRTVDAGHITLCVRCKEILQ